MALLNSTKAGYGEKGATTTSVHKFSNLPVDQATMTRIKENVDLCNFMSADIGKCLACPLCSVPGEAILCKQISNADKSTSQHFDATKCSPSLLSEKGSKIENRIGIGCVLFSETCFSSEHMTNYDTLHHAIKTFPLKKNEGNILCKTKNLILRVAACIPICLYKKPLAIAAKATTSDKTNDNNFSILKWIEFVQVSFNERMLAQAYAVLVSMLNKAKLPKWWQLMKGGSESETTRRN